MRTLDRKEVTFKGVNSNNGEPMTVTYKSGETYNINGTNRSGDYMIQQYWSNYCSNAYNFITSTNWLKLRSVNVSYDFSSLLNKNKFIKGLVVSAAANNLFTWTNYVGGMDPEVAAVGSGTGGSGSVGIDYCGVPTQRTFSFGVNLTF